MWKNKQPQSCDVHISVKCSWNNHIMLRCWTENAFVQNVCFWSKGQAHIIQLKHESHCKLSLHTTKRKPLHLQLWPSSERDAQCWMFQHHNVACVMPLQRVNKKPYCCKCHTITPCGSHLNVCLCNSLCSSVSTTYGARGVCPYTCLLTVLLPVCGYVTLRYVHMYVCLLDWTLHPHISVLNTIMSERAHASFKKQWNNQFESCTHFIYNNVFVQMWHFWGEK